MVAELRSRAVLLGVLACAGCAGHADGAPAPDDGAGHRPCVDVVIPEEEDVPDVIGLRAQLVAERHSTLMSRQSGLLASLAVDAGDHVTRGTPLALVSANELGHLVEATNAEVEAASARVRRLEIELGAAHREAARGEELLASGGISQQRRDQLASREAEVEAAIAEARAAESSARGHLAQTRSMANNRAIVAPFDGVVTRRFVEVGELVSSFPPTPLLEIVDDSALRAYVYVPQRHADRLEIGAPATVICPEGAPRAGALAFVAADVDAATRTVATYVSLENQDHQLRHGEACQAQIELQRTRRRLLPRDALVGHQGGRATVFRLASDDGIVRAIDVQIGPLTDAGYPVLEGLPEGARVVSSGASTLRDGVKVRVAEGGSCGAPAGDTHP